MNWKSLKILELAGVLAGPSVGSFFAELSAEVIKVENPKTGGDITRQWRLKNESNSTPVSAYYSSANFNKTVKFIDLTTELGQEEISKLISWCDVVIVNFKSESAKRLHLDFETVKTINPQIIYANIQGFDEGDPRPAFDVVLQAESGFMSMNGQPEGLPTKMPVALIDVLAAHQLKEGILVALLEQQTDHKAKHVKVSLYGAALSALANQASNYLMVGHVPKRMGSQHPNIAPYGDLYTTLEDKWLVLAVGTENQFQQLAAYLSQPELQSEIFSTNAQRVKHRSALNRILQNCFQQHNLQPLKNDLLNRGIPCGAIKNLGEVFEDPAAQQWVKDEIVEGVATKKTAQKAFTITSASGE